MHDMYLQFLLLYPKPTKTNIKC